MIKNGCKLFLLMAFVLSIAYGGPAESAQTINGKALGSVDDVVREVNKGDLSLQKKGLITLRAGEMIDDIDVFATTFGKDATASTKRLYHNSSASRRFHWTRYAPHYLRPAVSRKLYNGKRALMTHNFAPNGQLKYYFKTLSNTRTENSTDTSTSALVNSVQIADFGEYTTAAFANSDVAFIPQVYGTGVMEVKGYEREIFVAASGPNHPDWLDKTMRLEFFAVSADSEGKMTQEPLTALTHETPFRSTGVSRTETPESPKIVSLAVGDLDGDKYDNEVALMINTENDIYVFVYRLTLSDGKLVLRAMGEASGLHVHSTNMWDDDLESQPATDMAVGDFDGDGKDEIAVIFKQTERALNLKYRKSWPEGPKVGKVYHCRVFQWNASKKAFDLGQGTKAYDRNELNDGTLSPFPSARLAGVIGLRATAADLDGDGKDEIVTLLLGYSHYKSWENWMITYDYREDQFYAYPHLAVWTFNRGSITPIHDDNHVKGGGEAGSYRYNWGPLYDMSDNKSKGLLMNEPHLSYKRIWYSNDNNTTSGTSPKTIRWMYALTDFSIAAGPFTGTLGQAKTVDDIAVAWKRNGEDRVTVFKTKLNGAKQFDGFEDGKLVIQDKKDGGTWRGLIAADIASEGVELDKPVHLRKKSNRSYIAALSAVPYHVDTVSADGTALTGGDPVNFTYSEPMSGGNMTVSYGSSTTDSKTNTVKQDLSQSVETMIAADPDLKGGETFGKVKGMIGFVSAIGDIAHGISLARMTPEQKRDAVWQPASSTAGLTEMLDFFTDKVESIDLRTNTESSTTTITKDITATTHDAILYTDTARHIWRYPVLTRPLPMWLAWGPRIDSTQIGNPTETLKKGEKELFLTFTMSENSPLHTSSSIDDDLYQPLHEEGNFFSYPPNIADVEGYNELGLLAGENTWVFSDTLDKTGITFTKATSNMRETEKKVTPSGFTSTVNFFDRLFNGDKARGIKMPDTDNPKTFSKEYSKSESISYILQGSSMLTAMRAADHKVKMQPFVAKEGAMTLATAVELSSTNYARLWQPSSIYQQKPDPSLLLPFKFVKDGGTFRPNTNEQSAMKIRGIRFYAPDFAFFTDNRFINGMNYQIRVPLYNASFKDTGDFTVRLSWTTDNSPKATTAKQTIGEITMSLGGWKNNKNNNKGTAVFDWKPNLTPNKQYYLYVEIDPNHGLDEVHEERYKADNTTINDYGGNNTGFYPFYAYNPDGAEASGGTVISSNAGMFSAAADDEIQFTPLYFTDGDGQTISDMAAFIKTHSDDSFVTITANFTYSGQEVRYAFLMGCLLSQSGRQKIPGASLNTIVDLSALEASDISDVFSVNDIALFNGLNKVTFTVSPAELIAWADEIAAVASSATFGIIALTDEEVQAVEEFYEGVDPSFELEPIPDNIVSSATSKTYTLTANENVFWAISNVKINGVSTSNEGDDDRDYLDITLETVSEDEAAPSNYGKIAIITVSSIAGYTPKGDYELTVQKSEDCDEWTDAETLKFNADDAEYDDDDDDNHTVRRRSSGSGCNAGLGFGTLIFLLGGVMAFSSRKKDSH